MATRTPSTPAKKAPAAGPKAGRTLVAAKTSARSRPAVAPSRPLADATEADGLRHAAIAEAAYLMAEGRGFAPGHELEDWLRAEAAYEAANGGA